MSSTQLRVDRLLVSRGLGGRRDIQRLIKRGLVSANGQVLFRPETRVNSDIEILIAGEVSRPLPHLIAYHKPVGKLSTLRDPWGRSGLDQVLPETWRKVFHPVGRLDADTSGLLLFSSDGKLTQKLLHPKYDLPRTYRAHIQANPTDLATKLTSGVQTSLGSFTAKVEYIRALQSDDSIPTGAENAVAIIELTVCEGKHRMVRRMLHNAGASVLALHRVRYGSITLGSLVVGTYREVDQHEFDLIG